MVFFGTTPSNNRRAPQNLEACLTLVVVARQQSRRTTSQGPPFSKFVAKMTDTVLSFESKKLVIQATVNACETSDGRFLGCTMHDIFNRRGRKFKIGVFDDGWTWFKKNEKPYQCRRTHFRALVNYASDLQRMPCDQFMEEILAHGIAHQRGEPLCIHKWPRDRFAAPAA